MKKLITLLLCCALICSCFSCAETPDKDIVVNKGEGTLEDKIENSTGNGLDIDIDSREYIETENGYYFHETDNFTSSNGVVTYNIDADVYIPNDTQMPVFKVEPRYWTAETAENFSRIFIGDSTVYEYTDAKSKKDLQKTILEIQQELNDRDALLEYYEGNEELVKYRVDQLTEKLSAAEAEYETASDTVEKVVSDFTFHDDTYWYSGYGVLDGANGYNTIKATTEVDDIPMYIWIQHQEEDSFRVISYHMYAYTADLPEWSTNRFTYCQTHEFTQEEIDEATALVERKLAEINIIENTADWKIAQCVQCVYDGDNISSMMHVSGTKYYYLLFNLTPFYDGYEGLTFTTYNNVLPTSSVDKYVGEFSEEAMYIEISNGKIIDVSYKSPLEICETLNSNVEIQSYDDAINRIYTQLELCVTGKKVSIPPYTNYYVVSSILNVSEIRFCLVRAPIKNTFDEYYLIPAWCVYGVYDMLEISDGVHTAVGFSIYNEDTPLFVLNAIDGSVLNSAI